MDRTRIRYGQDNNGSYDDIPKNEYEVSLMTARPGNFTGDREVALLHNERNAEANELIYHQAPPGTELIPNTRHSVVMIKKSPGRKWSCGFTTTGQGLTDTNSLPDWTIHNRFSAKNTMNKFTNDVNTHSGSCKIEITGRPYAENVPHIRSMGITNPPENGYGFFPGDTVEITVVFTEPITGTLSMRIDIGSRMGLTATASGENTDTFVFEYEVLSSDVDANGITFGTNVLNGFLAADVGHTNLWPNRKNGVKVPPIITDIRVTSAPDDPAVGYTTGEEMDLTFTFDKPIEVIGTGIRLTMTFHDGRVDPITCDKSHWRPSMRYDAAKSTSTTMVFSAAVIDDIHDDQAWVNNNDIQLHGGTVTDGWRPTGSQDKRRPGIPPGRVWHQLPIQHRYTNRLQQLTRDRA